MIPHLIIEQRRENRSFINYLKQEKTMEKYNVQTVNEEDLKAATGGFSAFRGCKSLSSKKNCENYSDWGCRWNEKEGKCGG